MLPAQQERELAHKIGEPVQGRTCRDEPRSSAIEVREPALDRADGDDERTRGVAKRDPVTRAVPENAQSLERPVSRASGGGGAAQPRAQKLVLDAQTVGGAAEAIDFI